MLHSFPRLFAVVRDDLPETEKMKGAAAQQHNNNTTTANDKNMIK
jgi:hypothetical protein